MTRVAPLLAVGILLTALTGCVATADALPSESPSPAPTVSAAPEPTISPKPALALRGSCDAIVDAAALSELVEGGVAPAEAQDSGRVWAVTVLGGIDCSWIEENGDAFVWLEVIPAAGLEAQVAESAADSPYCYGGPVPENRCSFSVVAGGYWLSGIVGMANGSSATALDVIDDLASRVAAAAEEFAPVPAVRPDGMWQTPTDCPTFGAAIDTNSILGMSFSSAAGSRGGEVPAGFSASLTVVGDFSCVWTGSTEDRWFTSEVLPGAAWGITELAAIEGAEPVTVAGAMQAVAVPSGGGTSDLYATDGVNLAWVHVPDDDIDRSSAAALTAAVMAASSR